MTAKTELLENADSKTRAEWAEYYNTSVGCIDQYLHHHKLKAKRQRTVSAKTRMIRIKREQYRQKQEAMRIAQEDERTNFGKNGIFDIEKFRKMAY